MPRRPLTPPPPTFTTGELAYMLFALNGAQLALLIRAPPERPSGFPPPGSPEQLSLIEQVPANPSQYRGTSAGEELRRAFLRAARLAAPGA